MEINQIYSTIIREYSNDQSHKGNLEDATDSHTGVNPSCGDEIKLNLNIKDGKIKQAKYEGIGCAISQASTSMMIALIEGKTVEEVKELIQSFLAMIKGDLPEKDLEKLEDAIALESISKLPMRVKCAVLAWRTLELILDSKNEKWIKNNE